MSLQPVARRYAKALFELALETHSLEKVTSEVRSVADALVASPELETVLTSPTVPVPARVAVMTAVLERLAVSPMVKNAVLLITERSRASVLPRIAATLGDLADEKAGRVRAEVTSAVALSEAQYQQITASLQKLAGRSITLVRNVDPSLIGGVITRIGDTVYDGSLRARLEGLRSALLAS